MGDRYIIDVICDCGNVDTDVYYAPTCGFVDHICTKCGKAFNLEYYTGITYEDASNADEIKNICK